MESFLIIGFAVCFGAAALTITQQDLSHATQIYQQSDDIADDIADRFVLDQDTFLKSPPRTDYAATQHSKESSAFAIIEKWESKQ